MDENHIISTLLIDMKSPLSMTHKWFYCQHFLKSKIKHETFLVFTFNPTTERKQEEFPSRMEFY